ncbi:receptor-transporting protein 3-like [Hydractinia symbiolongicarpus]|uniref:receptor-transporting protein 3-like n=1 Tax=Hydractinia symbiolongicarpus TaxID=13093 RepID=UPI00254FDCFD|nr:receptor-transporting protein 3-like [Hydractinia symbiolongicarpus]
MSNAPRKLINEKEWQEIFTDVFSDLEDKELQEHARSLFEPPAPIEARGKLKASYTCHECSKRWTSYYSYMRFTYRLLDRKQEKYGEVTFFAKGQRCNRCPKEDYTMPLCRAESIEKALLQLLEEVKGKYYYKPGEQRSIEVDTETRESDYKPRKRHDTVNCQACEEGVCMARDGRRIIDETSNTEHNSDGSQASDSQGWKEKEEIHSKSGSSVPVPPEKRHDCANCEACNDGSCSGKRSRRWSTQSSQSDSSFINKTTNLALNDKKGNSSSLRPPRPPRRRKLYIQWYFTIRT